MKRNFTLKTIFAVLMLLSAVNLYAQDRTCGMLEYMEEMLKDPVLAKEYEKNQKLFKAEVAKRVANEFDAKGGSIVIPVAVHFPSGNEADRACLVALAQSQIDILNADYSAMNSDISDWTGAAGLYPGLSPGSANISFCIAVSNHPVGADPELLEGEPAVTIGYNFANGSGFPEFDSNFQGYMNFVVKDIGAGLLGYSPFGGSVANGAAVVMNLNAFGTGPGCPGSGIVPQPTFNLGRTVTHELGHFYNLDHPWGGSGGCGQDDGIVDTPTIDGPTYGCPGLGAVAACTTGEFSLTMNYMDYVDDACMYMFTPNQMSVVDAYVAGVLAPQFKPNVCAPPTPGFNLIANNAEVSTCPTIDTQAVFNLSYNTILSFSETTTFSASGAPAGATVNFSPGSLNTDGDFTMTIGNLGATVEGEYTITVTGMSASVTETVDVLLKNECTEIVCSSYDSAPNLNIATLDPDAMGNPGVVGNSINIPDSEIIESMTVTVNVDHTFVADLLLQLQHPNGTDFANIWQFECNDENDMVITFDDTAGAIVCAEPITGTYAPSNPLSPFNGLDAQGDWTLVVVDFGAGDTGTFNSWSIEICSEQPLSIEEFGTDEFAIFPNPNEGEFTIKLNSSSNSDISVDVFDIRGRRIFKNTYANNSQFNEVVRLNNVQSGMYLVTVTDGNKKTTKKIIIE